MFPESLTLMNDTEYRDGMVTITLLVNGTRYGTRIDYKEAIADPDGLTELIVGTLRRIRDEAEYPDEYVPEEEEPPLVVPEEEESEDADA